MRSYIVYSMHIALFAASISTGELDILPKHYGLGNNYSEELFQNRC